MDITLNSGGCCVTKKGCDCKSNKKLGVYDWLSDLPETMTDTDFVEVQFKNTRKGFFLNSTKIPLEKGDIVAVESSPGHDIGEVTLVGRLVLLQMNKNNIDPDRYEIRRVYRKAREVDIEKFNESKAREQQTMIKARQIADSLKLNMKIGDVEFQGDGNKAIFYYIADERVDFRELIKLYAEEFRIRIEMRQIGARQEAGRIGGIGPCGRELCCSGWITNFNSVSTTAARVQDISLNPQKLAGQCGKLKCCLNYEVDTYIDAQKDFPPTNIELHTENGSYQYVKADIFKRIYLYSLIGDKTGNFIPVPVDRVREIILQNQKGKNVARLVVDFEPKPIVEKIGFEAGSDHDTLTRFDKTKNSDNKRRGKNNHRRKFKPKS